MDLVPKKKEKNSNHHQFEIQIRWFEFWVLPTSDSHHLTSLVNGTKTTKYHGNRSHWCYLLRQHTKWDPPCALDHWNWPRSRPTAPLSTRFTAIITKGAAGAPGAPNHKYVISSRDRHGFLICKAPHVHQRYHLRANTNFQKWIRPSWRVGLTYSLLRPHRGPPSERGWKWWTHHICWPPWSISLLKLVLLT